jgi:3-dehydroquinate dehydratase
MYIKKKGSETRSVLLQLANERRVYIEGPILKVLEAEEGDIEFAEYLNNCIERDLTARRKRLQVTKQVQKQNTELATASEEKAKLLADLEIALEESKRAESDAIQLSTQESIEKQKALEDLDFLQKRAQFKMMGLIVKMALGIIIGVGVFTTGLYVYVIAAGVDSTIVESTWSNLFGILLTNSFSIIGTIMGVRYANKEMNRSDEFS